MRNNSRGLRLRSPWTKVILAALAGLTVLGLPVLHSARGAEPAGSFEIPAYAFDRGNAKTFTVQYADAGPMVAFGGDSPVVVEYEIDFPVGAAYTLNIRYAAGVARPVELYLDQRKLGRCPRRRRDIQRVQQPDTDQLHIQRKLRQLQRRDIQRVRQPNANQLHTLGQ